MKDHSHIACRRIGAEWLPFLRSKRRFRPATGRNRRAALGPVGRNRSRPDLRPVSCSGGRENAGPKLGLGGQAKREDEEPAHHQLINDHATHKAFVVGSTKPAVSEIVKLVPAVRAET
jgi:hypothetical protein